MREVLKKLLALEEVDRQLRALAARRAAVPREREGHVRAVARARERLRDVQERDRELQKTIDHKQLELESMEERIRKAEVDLQEIRSNEAYRAKLLEIEGLKADKSRLEDTILELSYRRDDLQAEIAEARSGVAAAEREQAVREEELRRRDEALAAEMGELKAERDRRREGIPTEVLALYERILARRQDRALAPAVDQHCQGCQMTLTLQELAQLTQCREILTCRTCSRILYLEEALAEA